MDTIEQILPRMSYTEKQLLIAMIDCFGTGQHPAATPDALPFFRKAYVKWIVDTAYPHLNPGAQLVADGIKIHLE